MECLGLSLRCEWLNESENIIIVHFSTKWTLDEFRDAEARVQQYARQVKGRFDIITDFTADVILLPRDSLSNWLTLAEQRDRNFPNWGLTVWIMEKSILESYFDTGHELSEAIRKHVRRAITVSEATRMIMEHRQAAYSGS